MTRTPLRPLARILSARARGENPDTIERENIRLRQEKQRDKARSRAEMRLLMLGAGFAMAFSVIGGRMGLMAATEPVEPRSANSGAQILAGRADLTDRNGRILATNLLTHSLYAQPKDMIDPARVASELAKIFPDLDAKLLQARFTDGRSFMWVRKKLSPEQMQAVHDIGDPGLLFGPREMRLYPNGRLAAHVLGGASFGAEGVHSAEVIGTAGIEKALDSQLRDPALDGAPVALSLDLTVQATTQEVLEAGMKMMNAKGAAAILMDVHTGEIISLVSLPDFDPNDRPQALVKGDPADSPLFNRAVQGVYELGSTFKIFAAAQAMDLGLVNPDTMVDADAPMIWGKFRIKEFENHNYGPLLSVRNVIVKSSNVGIAHVALQIGAVRQQAFLKSLGFFAPTPVELIEAAAARPLIPRRWSDIVTITTSYGHGMSASPMHLAAAYATIANGGRAVRPTLLKIRPPAGRGAHHVGRYRGQGGVDAARRRDRGHGQPRRCRRLFGGGQDRHGRQAEGDGRLLQGQGRQYLRQHVPVDRAQIRADRDARRTRRNHRPGPAPHRGVDGGARRGRDHPSRGTPARLASRH